MEIVFEETVNFSVWKDKRLPAFLIVMCFLILYSTVNNIFYFSHFDPDYPTP
jgi:hypothetical protein